jgi:lipopolysaccharide export system protein LptA
MSKRAVWRIIPALLLSVSLVRAQSPVRLIHADSLIGYTRGNDSYRELIGHVQLRQDTMTLGCDRAVQNLTEDNVSLFGHVRVKDDTLTLLTSQANYSGRTKTVVSDSAVYLNDTRRTLTANRGTYDSETKVARFYGDVFVRDSSSQLKSDTLVYYRNDDRTFADGGVKIRSLDNNVTVYGGHFEDYGKKKYSLITLSPLLVQIDTASDGKIDTMMITGRSMEAFRDSLNERFTARDSVQIIRGSLSARCGLGTYFSNDSLVVLQRNPVVWYEDNQLSGDSVAVYIENKNLSRVDVAGSAFAVSQSDSIHADRFNQLKGKRLSMTLHDRKVNRIIVESNATSLYYLYDKEKPNGANRVSGDKVVMYFTDGKIDKISVISGVEGDYYPENMVDGRFDNYNLAGFSYRKNRPTEENFPNVWK